MEKWFSYYAPIQKSNNMQFNVSSWKKATKLFEKKEYKKSFVELLKYADSKVAKHKVSENVYKIPHWSVFVDIDFSGEEIIIKSDFLEVSEANKIPLFREISELNFNWLNLSQIKLRENNLVFEYSCPVNLYEPNKIWDVMAEICYFSDKYDEEFTEKFKAKSISEGKITPLNDNDKDKIYDNFKNILKEGLDFIKDLEDKRQNYYIWDVLSITMKRIATSCQPNWALSVRIGDEINNLYSREISIQDIVYKGKEFLNELDKMKKEDFTKELFIADEFIPRKKVASNQAISEYLKPGFADATADLKAGNILWAYLIFTHILYNSLYYHLMPKGMEKSVRKKLKFNNKRNIEYNYVCDFSVEILELINLENIASNASWFWWILRMIIFAIFGFVLWALFN